MSTKIKVACESNVCIVTHLSHLLRNSTFCGQHSFKFALKKAIKSVAAFPFPIESESEALALEGVGPSLAREIMKAYSKSPTDLEDKTIEVKSSTNQDDIKYKPSEGKGPWAILCALQILGGIADKAKILETCERNSTITIHHSCDLTSSAVWSRSTKTLKDKGIITEIKVSGHSIQYALTKPVGEEVVASFCSIADRSDGGLTLQCKASAPSAVVDEILFSSSRACEENALSASAREVVVLSDDSDHDDKLEACWDLTQDDDTMEYTSQMPLLCAVELDKLVDGAVLNRDPISNAIPLRERLLARREQSVEGYVPSEIPRPGDALMGDIYNTKSDSRTTISSAGAEGDKVVDLMSSDDSDDNDDNDSNKLCPEPSHSLALQLPSYPRSDAIPLYVDATVNKRRRKDTSASSKDYASSVGPTGSRNTQTFLLSQSSTCSVPPSNSRRITDASAYVTNSGGDRENISLKEPIRAGGGGAGDLGVRWEVVLLIDKREKEYSFFESFMLNHGVRAEVCQLAIGDYMWVAKQLNSRDYNSGDCINVYDEMDEDGYSSSASSSSCSNPQASPSRSIATRKRKASSKQLREAVQRAIRVLDCIVERKTVIDLASSIVDGRYDEQKQRLCGCGVPHVVYLVEGVSLNPQGVGGGGRGAQRPGRGRGEGPQERTGTRGAGVNSAAILTALASTQAMGLALGMCRAQSKPQLDSTSDDDIEEPDALAYQEDRPKSHMHVVNTRGLDHTALHLLCLHRRVEAHFRETSKDPVAFAKKHPLSLWEFQSISGRNQRIATVGQLHVAQLRQVQGCSVSAATALSSRFGGTMFNMHQRLSSMVPVAAKDCIADLQKIGPTGKHSKVGGSVAKNVMSVLLG